MRIPRPLIASCLLVHVGSLSGCNPAAAPEPPQTFKGTDISTDAGVLETYSAAPAIAWEPVPGTVRYEVEMASGASFSPPSLRDTTPVPRYVPSNGLGPGNYWWRARAEGDSAWRVTGQLKVLQPEHVFDIPADADARVIRDIIQQASRNTPALVRFPERGQFRLSTAGELFELRGTHRLVVDGRGSTITFTSPMSGVGRLSDTREISIKDLIIKHDPPPFTVGVIRSVDRATRELHIAVEPGHPDFDAPHILADWAFCMFLEAQPRGRILDNSPLVPGLDKKSLRRIPGGFAVRVTDSTPLDLLAPGVRVVQFARKSNARSLFHAERSADTAFLRIMNHSISGGHYLLLESDGARILNCHSLPAPGFGYGANADGAHVRSSITGPWIEGCSFEAIGDDGVALFAKGMQVLGQTDDGGVVLDKQFFNLKPGHEILFFNPRDGAQVGTQTHVRSVEPDPAGSGGFLVRLDPPLREKLVHDFDEAWNNDQAFNMTAMHRDFVIRRNTFRDIRRYGIIARANHGAIEDNWFEGISDSAITLQNEPNFWRNGLQSTGISITGNRMLHCNFAASARGRGVIHVELRALSDLSQRWEGVKPSPWRGHRDIVITGNRISDWRGCAMSLQNIDGLVLENNRILDQRPSLDGMPPARAIFLENVRKIQMGGNSFEGLQPDTAEILREP